MITVHKRWEIVANILMQSGYRVTLMPLWQETHAPAPVESIHYKNWCPTTEPIAMELSPWRSRRVPNMPEVLVNGNYFISWYVGEISADAVSLSLCTLSIGLTANYRKES